jgi:hypothetical protein
MNYKAIIILCIMSCVSLCDAMEIPTKNSKIRALGFPAHDKIIIAGDHYCELYSTVAKSSFLFDEDDNIQGPIYDMAISSDNEKVALVKAKDVVLYDLVGDNRQKITFPWIVSAGVDRKISFRACMLCVCNTQNYPHIIDAYNYITETTSEKIFQPAQFYGGVKVIGDSHPIIITDLDHMRERELESARTFYALPFTYSERFPSGEINCDETLIAINMFGKKYRFINGKPLIINGFQVTSKEFEIPVEENENEDAFYISIAFHKNNITAALLRSDGCIEFWDYKNKTLLGTMNCKDDESMLWKDRDCRDQLLSFGPDCKQLVASLGRKIYLYQTPFQAICTLGTKEHCVALLHVLRNYSIEIPHDIRCNIIAHFLWCSEFGNQKKVNEIIDKIISQKDDKMASFDMEAQEMSDEEDDDFCPPNLKKIYLYSMMVLVGVGAMCTFGS